MEQARFCKHGPLRRIVVILALAAATSWCTASVAADEDSTDWRRHRHDEVTITGTPAGSVAAGTAYSFTPVATDSDGRTLVFAIEHKPAWASFSPTTGQLSGTPPVTSVGTYSDIVIAASDGWRSAVLTPFAVTVVATASNPPPPPPPPTPPPTPPPAPPPVAPPTIAGTPATSDVAGSAYSFQPSASGPSGMTLSFSVQNKPAWANFSIATGLLSGTPTSAQTGAYSNIVLSVSDGQASSALPGFTVTVTPASVTPPSTGSATVNWVPPTQNTNGTPLTNLAGIIISYGTSASNLNQQVTLASATQSSYTISNLASGTWYFGGVAYNSAGTQSSMSQLVSATVP
jgi:hypothetical protein